MSETHHPLSPSNYNPWAKCVHFRSANKESSEANAGTEIHRQLQKAIDYAETPTDPTAEWAYNWVLDAAGEELNIFSELRLNGYIGCLTGVYGTADIMWEKDGEVHIADLKSFSNGIEDYSPQLKGYASLWGQVDWDNRKSKKVWLHILHGGKRWVETIETTIQGCFNETDTLLQRVNLALDAKCPNHWCQYCKHCSECEAATNAIAVTNNSSVFASLPLAKKYAIVLEAEKIIKVIKDEAKAAAIDNGGVLESDGVRFEIKTRAGKSVLRDFKEVHDCVLSPTINGKDANPLSIEALADIVSVGKTDLAKAMKEANADRKDIKKKEIDEWVAQFYEQGEPTTMLVKSE